MTQSELDRALARATGESRRTIRQYGFNLVVDQPEPQTVLSVLLDCPGCGGILPRPDGPVGEFVECPRCDAVYPFSPDELYTADVPSAALAAPA